MLSALSAHLLSQVSPCLHQHHFQYKWGATQSPLHCQGQANTWDYPLSERVVGRSTGTGSGRKYSTRPRAWRGQQSPLLHHQILTSFGRRVTTYPFRLYGRLRQRLLTSTQPILNHHSHPPIGWPTVLIHLHHPGLGSSRKERPQQQHSHTQPTGTRLITRPATPLGCKPRKVVGSRPPPKSSSIEALWQYKVYFGKVQKVERGTGAEGSSKKEEDSQAV